MRATGGSEDRSTCCPGPSPGTNHRSRGHRCPPCHERDATVVSEMPSMDSVSLEQKVLRGFGVPRTHVCSFLHFHSEAIRKDP